MCVHVCMQVCVYKKSTAKNSHLPKRQAYHHCHMHSPQDVFWTDNWGAGPVSDRQAGTGSGNLALSPRINIVVRSENTPPCSYSYHLDFADNFMASQAEVSLVNNQYRAWTKSGHHKTTYPAVMFDMSVWVCVPCHCVWVATQSINLSISIAVGHIKQAFTRIMWITNPVQLHTIESVASTTSSVVESTDYSWSDCEGSSN